MATVAILENAGLVYVLLQLVFFPLLSFADADTTLDERRWFDVPGAAEQMGLVSRAGSIHLEGKQTSQLDTAFTTNPRKPVGGRGSSIGSPSESILTLTLRIKAYPFEAVAS